MYNSNVSGINDLIISSVVIFVGQGDSCHFPAIVCPIIARLSVMFNYHPDSPETFYHVSHGTYFPKFFVCSVVVHDIREI